METVSTSAEHHFLTTLHKIKQSPTGWVVLHFCLSKVITHDQILEQPAAINKTLSVARAQSQNIFDTLKEQSGYARKSILYLFDDNDIIMLVPTKNKDDQAAVKKLFLAQASKLPEHLSDFSVLEHDIYAFQKLADKKLLSAKAMQAYRTMADRHKISSIPLRRDKRDYPLVQVIEDDRFTASYTTNILSREYDMILTRNGEDGVLQYIDHAPDIVLIDIHLPGLSGHQVLNSLKAIDPNVYAVMLSVDTVKDNIVKSAEGGANNFLKKPFSKDRLINIVRSSPFVQSTIGKNAASLRTH